jgi:hypothetical protein
MQTITVNGQVYNLLPMTPAMEDEILAFCRSKRIKELVNVGIENSIVGKMISDIVKTNDLQEILSSSAIPYALFLRTDKSGKIDNEIEQLRLQILDIPSMAFDQETVSAILTKDDGQKKTG